MEQTITPRKVMGVVLEANAALRDKGFNQAEVVLGLQELVGRLIVEMANTPVGADELVKHAKGHLEDTVRIGMEAKGQSLIQRV